MELNIGIVGAGTIGAVHANAIISIAGARLVAIAEPREDAGRALAAAHGAEWHTDLADLLRRPDVDVVVIATPSGLHADQTVYAAEAEKHVITEKPMATTLVDVDRMIAACQQASVSLSVIFQNRFSRDAVRLRRAVAAGLLGRPIIGNALVHWHRSQAYYDATDGWRGTWALDGGGALMNQSIHTIDLLQWILGPLDRLSAETATLSHRIETEDTATATLRFRSGALGMIQGTTSASQDWPVRVEIIGTAGRAVLEGGCLTTWQTEREVDDTELLSSSDLSLTAGAHADEPFGAAHERQLRAIVAALRTGEAPPVPGDDARKAIEIILAIYRSAATGEAVTLPG